MSSKKIWQYPEATSITNDDYILMDSNTETGSQCLKANKIGAVHITKTVTERKVYKASDDNANGFSEVTVAVPYTDVHYDKDDIVSFVGEDLPLKSVTAYIEPQQDLHGYDAPWVGGAGKNKLPLTVENLKAVNTSGTWNGDAYTLNNIVFTIQKDSNNNVTGININGTASAQTQFTLITKNRSAFLVSGISYTMTGCPSNGSDNTYRLLLSDDLVDTYRDYGSGVTFTPADALLANNYSTRFVISSGQAFTNYTFKPMIRLASVTDATFAPYSNICPISGWDEGNVNNSGVNVWDEEWEVGTIQNTNGQNISDQTRIRSKNYIPVTPSTTYYMVCPIDDGRGLFYDANKNYLGNDSSMFVRKLFTTPPNCYYIRFSPVSSYGTTYNNDISINYPSTDTEYHAYNGSTITIPFLDAQGNPIEVYGGKLDVVNGGGSAYRNVVIFDGTETFTAYGTTFVCSKILPEGLTTSGDDIICSHAIRNYISFSNSTKTTVQFKGDYFGVSTVEEFKALLASWVSSNKPLQFSYELATPTTFYTQPTSISSQSGVNNIWADCGPVAVEWQTLYVTPTT